MQKFLMYPPNGDRLDNNRVRAAAKSVPFFTGVSIDSDGEFELRFDFKGREIVLDGGGGACVSGEATDHTVKVMFELQRQYGAPLVIADQHGYQSPELSSLRSVEVLFDHMDRWEPE